MSEQKIKSITVKVECMKTEEVVKEVPCGDNQRKADKIESALEKIVDLDRFYVYQSHETKELQS
jgi:hypothetical protein